MCMGIYAITTWCEYTVSQTLLHSLFFILNFILWKMLTLLLTKLLIQTTELTIKINMLTSMVMGVYNKTLSKERFLNIANSFFDRLHSDMETAYLKMEQNRILSDNAVLFRNKMNSLISILESKRQWCE